MASSKDRKQGGAGGSDMSRFYWIFGAVALAGVAVVGYTVGRGGAGTAASEPIEVEGTYVHPDIVAACRDLGVGGY